MPLYDYQCDHCQKTFEVRASFQEKELGLEPTCPDCQSVETHQVLTLGLFVRSGINGGENLQSSSCGPNAGPGCCG
jgi:putative FmdB family regulatory protein